MAYICIYPNYTSAGTDCDCVFYVFYKLRNVMQSGAEQRGHNNRHLLSYLLQGGSAVQWQGAGLVIERCTAGQPRSTQPSIPPGQVNRVPAYWLGLRRGAFTCVGWQVTLCDPIWQVTSRSSRTSSCRGLYSALTLTLLIFLLPQVYCDKFCSMHQQYSLSYQIHGVGKPRASMIVTLPVMIPPAHGNNYTAD